MENKKIEDIKNAAEAQILSALNSQKEFMEKYYKEPTTTDSIIMNQYVDMQLVEIYSAGGESFLPQYATTDSSGMDLKAYIDEPLHIEPFQRILVPTGIYVNLPSGYEFQIRPRSGISYKRGLTLINCVGTIDADYVNEIKVPIVNLSQETQTIAVGERIAQMVLDVVSKVQWKQTNNTESFNSKDRVGGFGSTGKI